MENRQEVVKAYYASCKEIDRAKEAGQYGMEFINTKKVLDSYISRDKSILELGCGGGYYGMHYANSCQEYLGIDLSPTNIQAFQEQIHKQRLNNVRAEIGDATDLCHIKDNSYDIVLCLGPMYHHKLEDRITCIKECARVCKEGGVIAFAFINKIGAITRIAPIMGWDKLLTQKIDENVLTKGIDDIYPDIFFYSSPEEMLAESGKLGLSYERLAGLDFLLTDEIIEQFTEEQRKVWFHFADLVLDSKYCAGLANHAMLICRKSEE